MKNLVLVIVTAVVIALFGTRASAQFANKNDSVLVRKMENAACYMVHFTGGTFNGDEAYVSGEKILSLEVAKSVGDSGGLFLGGGVNKGYSYVYQWNDSLGSHSQILTPPCAFVSLGFNIRKRVSRLLAGPMFGVWAGVCLPGNEMKNFFPSVPVQCGGFYQFNLNLFEFRDQFRSAESLGLFFRIGGSVLFYTKTGQNFTNLPTSGMFTIGAKFSIMNVFAR